MAPLSWSFGSWGNGLPVWVATMALNSSAISARTPAGTVESLSAPARSLAFSKASSNSPPGTPSTMRPYIMTKRR